MPYIQLDLRIKEVKTGFYGHQQEKNSFRSRNKAKNTCCITTVVELLIVNYLKTYSMGFPLISAMMALSPPRYS